MSSLVFCFIITTLLPLQQALRSARLERLQPVQVQHPLEQRQLPHRSRRVLIPPILPPRYLHLGHRKRQAQALAWLHRRTPASKNQPFRAWERAVVVVVILVSSILSTVQVVMVVMSRLSLILSTVWVVAQKFPKEAAQKFPKEAAQKLPKEASLQHQMSLHLGHRKG